MAEAVPNITSLQRSSRTRIALSYFINERKIFPQQIIWVPTVRNGSHANALYFKDPQKTVSDIFLTSLQEMVSTWQKDEWTKMASKYLVNNVCTQKIMKLPFIIQHLNKVKNRWVFVQAKPKVVWTKLPKLLSLFFFFLVINTERNAVSQENDPSHSLAH